MNKIKYILISWLLLSSCSSEERNAGSVTKQQSKDTNREVQKTTPHNSFASDTMAFKEAFSLFFAAIQASDTATINQFIHPTHGLWIIEQPGAVPKMTNVTDIRRFEREFQQKSFFTVRNEVKKCILKEEKWPTFDCGDMDYDKGNSGYSKNGCFMWKPGRFPQSGYWNYASLTNSEIKDIKASLPYIQKSVLHTDTSFEFHFGFIDGHWRLLFTKLIYPCSA